MDCAISKDSSSDAFVGEVDHDSLLIIILNMAFSNLYIDQVVADRFHVFEVPSALNSLNLDFIELELIKGSFRDLVEVVNQTL